VRIQQYSAKLRMQLGIERKMMTKFEGVVPALGEALEKRGYTDLTPVQLAVLAPELVAADMLVSAQTGSGKTVAFGLAFAPTLLEGAIQFNYAESPLALVIAPTRELALQVKRELEWLYAPTSAIIASCVGGMDMRTERRTLDRGAHIVVGTPGRLRDHIERGSLDVSELRAVVLDEADEMLDMGFRDDLEYILESTPATRRTLMFSATVPRTIASMAKRYQRDAVRVTTAAESSQHGDIDYQALTCAPNDRENAIVNVLRYYDAKNAIIFCATRATVNHMTSRFANRGFSVVALSGELSQNERTHALQSMRDGRARVCVATDVAARGIDLPNLELVIHGDLPKNREGLLHRSGRTGRAGRKGVCALIVPHSQRKRTERLLGSANVKATWARPPSIEDVVKKDRERILASPVLNEPVSEDEAAFVQELLSKHSPEQIAAAYLRQHLAEQTAPEELADSGPVEQPRDRHRDGQRDGQRDGPRKKRDDDFANGVWFSISVGHEHNAEPRWILPTLCRAGRITKKEIGAIKIHQTETHVEIEPRCVDKFLEAIGPARKVDGTIDITRLEGVPDGPTQSRGGKGPKDRDYAKKRPFGSGHPGDKGRPDFKARSGDRPDNRRSDDKPRRSHRDDDRPPAGFKDKGPAKATFAPKDKASFAPKDKASFAPKEKRNSRPKEKAPYKRKDKDSSTADNRADDRADKRPAPGKDNGPAPRKDSEPAPSKREKFVKGPRDAAPAKPAPRRKLTLKGSPSTTSGDKPAGGENSGGDFTPSKPLKKSKGKKLKNKKPHKGKLARAAAKASGAPGKPGSGPLKRKSPSHKPD
jgi:ATP-dependent RNA helicase DeaD